VTRACSPLSLEDISSTVRLAGEIFALDSRRGAAAVSVLAGVRQAVQSWGVEAISFQFEGIQVQETGLRSE
jgi:hypothetical protein